MKNPKVVYLTKYALTAGIIKTKTVDQSDKYVWLACPGGINNRIMVKRDEVFTDEQAARNEVRNMVDRKLASLAKQEKRLRTYEPKVKEWLLKEED